MGAKISYWVGCGGLREVKEVEVWEGKDRRLVPSVVGKTRGASRGPSATARNKGEPPVGMTEVHVVRAPLKLACCHGPSTAARKHREPPVGMTEVHVVRAPLKLACRHGPSTTARNKREPPVGMTEAGIKASATLSRTGHAWQVAATRVFEQRGIR